MSAPVEQHRVVVVGAGVGGLGAAIELRRHGVADVVVLEADDDVGGTWHVNTYPGAACDVPSHLYSYSFAQRKDWTRLCSPQPEILDYVQDVARETGVADVVRTGTRVTSCTWDTQEQRWDVACETVDGPARVRAEVLVLATGQLRVPHVPRLPGLETFAGATMHSARWDHDIALEGRRVAVVGTGASAAQLVPEVAGVAAHLTVFQRSGNWFMPRKNRAYPAPVAAAVRHVPGVQAFRRRFMREYGEALTAMIRHPRTLGQVGRLRSTLHMRGQLKDPQVRRRAWPDYTFGCKRVLFSSSYLPTLQRDDVELVTDAVIEVVPEGLRTADGRLHEVDVIIWGTGFRALDYVLPMDVVGADGCRLREAWEAGPHAHLGMTVPGFPSMFLLYGPNTNTSGGSIIGYLEAQARYVRQAVAALDRRGAAALDVLADVEARSDAATQARFAGTAWTACDSWYRDGSGRVVTNWPGYFRQYLAAVEHLDPDDFEFLAPVGRAVPAS